MFTMCQVTYTKNKNAQLDQRDHHQHDGRERIEHPADAQRLFAEREPGEIVNDPEPDGLQRWQEREDRQCERNDLAGDCKRRRAFAPRVRETQDYQRSRERHRRNRPNVVDDPGVHPLSLSS
jgi:hypothetical protein